MEIPGFCDEGGGLLLKGGIGAADVVAGEGRHSSRHPLRRPPLRRRLPDFHRRTWVSCCAGKKGGGREGTRELGGEGGGVLQSEN